MVPRATHLFVEDLPRARAFYRDVLGLPFLFSAPPSLAFPRGELSAVMGASGSGMSRAGAAVDPARPAPLPSAANFVFARHAQRDAGELAAALRERGFAPEAA